MAKGLRLHQERQDAISRFGKEISKRAGFACEWCGSKEDLRVWDYRPDRDPEPDTLALLCCRCRELAAGKKPDIIQLRAIRNALWSTVPAVAEGAARILATGREPWLREAIEESFISEELKEELLR